MITWLNDFIPYLLVFAQTLIIILSVCFLISGLDDLFIDVCFGINHFRNLFSRLPPRVSTNEENLVKAPEQAIAVLIPAWDESSVIQPMLENTLATLKYENYYLFVGVYPNDPLTLAEVNKVKAKHKNVEFIICPHDGPTNKADCLNSIYQGIKSFEKDRTIKFEIFVMQDCEDVIHPLCYKVFNELVPNIDMVQAPVLSFPPKWSNFTAGHYLDEFAQGHYKDMIVRQVLDKSIPSAGVGTAFSRKACETLSRSHNNQLFSIHSLTEDYEFGLNFKRYGLTQIFLKTYVMIDEKSPIHPPTREKSTKRKDYICIREYFPSSMKASIRQKSRWVVGIVFQGWETLGWRGNSWRKYMLFRDRKAMVTNLVSLLGYLVVIIVVFLWILGDYLKLCPCYPPLIEPGSLTWYIIIINTVLFFWRLLLRAYCVLRFYGWQQALLSMPRMVWSNIINFFATLRAFKLYLNYVKTGRRISWDKTAHSYPLYPQSVSSKQENKQSNTYLSNSAVDRCTIMKHN